MYGIASGEVMLMRKQKSGAKIKVSQTLKDGREKHLQVEVRLDTKSTELSDMLAAYGAIPGLTLTVEEAVHGAIRSYIEAGKRFVAQARNAGGSGAHLGNFERATTSLGLTIPDSEP